MERYVVDNDEYRYICTVFDAMEELAETIGVMAEDMRAACEKPGKLVKVGKTMGENMKRDYRQTKGGGRNE